MKPFSYSGWQNNYVTDMLDLSPEESISLFKRRHLTEEFYRDAMQNLGLGK